MGACPSCGTELVGAPKFCPECGTRLEGPAAGARETRRVVTILFSDVTGSTALGEQLDPEAVRSLMARYFAAMRAVVVRHGGTVEKFIGDAVMAVFGIPAVHEDDALRAVRAAAGMREALTALNAELAAERGVTIRTRTGVTTGEVVAGDPAAGQTLVTGDTVNTAARLEQAAQPGEILIGEPTWRLVRDAVSAEPVDPVAAKGKALPVPAHRLVSVTAGAEGHLRRMDAPLVGRERELAALEEAWRSAQSSESARLVTVLAPAGVGKSRLVREFGATLGAGATVVVGRCLPYGDGITYWPIRELMLGLAGIEEDEDRAAAMAKLQALLPTGDTPEIAQIVAGAIGLGVEPVQQEAIFWAVKRVFEAAARRGPTAILVEDLHWAEQTLLDLLEYVVEMSTEPMLIVTTARPEMLSARPGWGTGASTELIRLGPLAGGGAEALLLAQDGAGALPAELRSRILDAAEGNALFVEEMVGILRDRGALRQVDGVWEAAADIAAGDVPPTIAALLAARLDELPTAERVVAEHGSVMGRSFEAAALAAIASTEHQVDLGRRLLALVRKELLSADRSLVTEGDAFRFRHILIRDAAYASLPKVERALLHERFADWLERAAGERIGEFHEIVGYHLEQAVRCRRALAMPDAATNALAQRAAMALRAAGRAARLRNDQRATASLLRRSIDLAVEKEPALGHDMRFLASALYGLGENEQGDRAAAMIDDLLTAIPDLELRLRRDLSRAGKAHMRGLPGSDRDVEAVARRVRAEAAGANIPGVQVSAMLQLGAVAIQAGRPMEEFRLLTEAEEVARRDSDPETLRHVRLFIANRLPFLPIPLDEAEARLLAMLDEPNVDAEQTSLIFLSLAYLAAADDRVDEARGRLADARRIGEEMGFIMPFLVADWPGFVAEVELLAGNLRHAEEVLRTSIEQLQALDDKWHLAGAAPLLARVIVLQLDRLDERRVAETERLVELGRESALPDDRLSLAAGVQALARVASWRGDHDRAVSLAREALDDTIPIGVPDYTAVAHLDLAGVLAAAGRASEAREAAEQARHAAAPKKLRAHLRLADSLLADNRTS